MNKPDDKKNILVLTPKMKKIIFNKRKTLHKSGPQEIDILSPALIKIISDCLEVGTGSTSSALVNDKW